MILWKVILGFIFIAVLSLIRRYNGPKTPQK